MTDVWLNLGLFVLAFLAGRITGLLTVRKNKDRAPKWEGYPGNAGGIPEEVEREAYSQETRRKRLGCTHPADEPCFGPKYRDEGP